MPKTNLRPYDAHLFPPTPSVEDWRQWDQRLPLMAWIERQVMDQFLAGNTEEAERLMAMWGDRWTELNSMLKPGSPEWVEANRP